MNLKSVTLWNLSMWAKYKFHRAQNFIDIKVSGPFSKREILELIEEIYASNDYTPEVNEIWDVSECKEALVFCNDLLEIAKREQSVRYVERGVKSAHVVSDPCTRQSMRDYLLLAKEVGYESRIFDNYQEALAWIISKP
ncbi:hypothetical protein FLL45_12740 [Aliikangiella marina]|uniref:STAS/SEC14 domain-containing protein n=1 Tax=Aliikangiella marina TaxID=1712262 RepID=A0A545T938_9GAMM|nr:hypothetical protein [Aliikangiella marina]TQV73731.1 hypothetical protein FLL45_12740 [Aliikangiella marina]